MPTLDAYVPDPDGVRPVRLTFGTRIEGVEPTGPARPRPDADAPLVVPGFVDVHVHGGAGADTMDGPKAIRTMARHHLRHGTTTLLPTTITQRWSQVMRALHGAREAIGAAADASPDDPLPDLPGVHLEGPFVSPQRLGAQPPHAIDPDPERVREATDVGVVRIVTLAPELPGAAEAARAFALAGVRVSFGHTRADAGQVRAVATAVREVGGVVGFTHLFNAMGGLGGRAPGVAGAALADRAAYAELILDGHHLDPVTVLAVHAAKPDRMLLITDAMRGSGLREGPSELGGQKVVIQNGAARLEDGTLAGSVATMDAVFRGAVGVGLTWHEAADATSATAARYLGLTDRGRIEAGARADLVALDADLRIRTVWSAGRPVPGTPAASIGERT
ncbi:MAG: N-acetylglucosamine-6-phosphate deacetylase [Trueperaceae bacterium]